MLKRFFAICAIVMGVVCNAYAKEYKAADGFVCAKMNDGTSDRLAGTDLAVYFDIGGTGENIGLHNGCEAVYQDIIKFYNSRAEDIDCAVLIGSADTQKKDPKFDNGDLSHRRRHYVETKMVNEFGDRLKKCAKQVFDAGDVDARFQHYDSNEQMARAVYVYILWKPTNCQGLNIDGYLNGLQSCDFTEKSQLVTLLNGCKTGSMGYTQSKKLIDLLMLARDSCLPIKEISVVDEAYARILGFYNELGLSVWRDEEGNFNKARLASDSIAAVVLGTAGGIITSKVVKKNQIKKGFEDLNCSVGGQRVAGWGDEIAVGLQ